MIIVGISFFPASPLLFTPLVKHNIWFLSFPLLPHILHLLAFPVLLPEGLLRLDGLDDGSHLGADLGRGQGLDRRGGVPGAAHGGADAPLELIRVGEGEREAIHLQGRWGKDLDIRIPVDIGTTAYHQYHYHPNCHHHHHY